MIIATWVRGIGGFSQSCCIFVLHKRCGLSIDAGDIARRFNVTDKAIKMKRERNSLGMPASEAWSSLLTLEDKAGSE